MSENRLSDDDLLRLQSYIDGELSADEHTAFEAELVTNPTLMAEVIRWQTLMAEVSLGQMADIDPEIDFSETIVAQIQAQMPPDSSPFGFVALIQVVIGLVVLIGGWPLITTIQPRSLSVAAAAGSAATGWINSLFKWVADQQQAVISFITDFAAPSLPPLGPETMTTLVVLAAVGGLIWLLSVRYILRTTDWRPA